MLKKSFESRIKGNLIWYSITSDFLRLRFVTDICDDLYVEVNNIEHQIHDKRVLRFFKAFNKYIQEDLSKYVSCDIVSVIVDITNVDSSDNDDIYSSLKITEIGCLDDKSGIGGCLYCKVIDYSED